MTLRTLLFTQSVAKFRLIGLIAFLALAYAVYTGGSVGDWLLAIALYFLYGCVGVAVTFHRYLTHKSFDIPKWKERVMAFVGHLAGTGSAIAWVATHVEHHKYSDTEADPHSAKNGVLKMLLLDYKEPKLPRTKTVLRLAADPFYKALHNYYLLLHIVWAVAIYSVFGLHGVLFGHLVPISFVFIASGSVNFFGHKGGSRRYNTDDTSANSFPVAFLSWGEGWHNNHHRFPRRPNFGEMWWELDVSWLVIKAVRAK